VGVCVFDCVDMFAVTFQHLALFSLHTLRDIRMNCQLWKLQVQKIWTMNLLIVFYHWWHSW